MNKDKIIVFLLMYFSYASLHMSRTSWSACTDSIELEWPQVLAKIIMSYVNTCFMIGYAIGLFVNGNFGDKLNPRYFYGYALLGTSVLYSILAFTSDHVKAPWCYEVMMFINGAI